MADIRLPLSAIRGMCSRRKRCATFAAHYGHPPDESSTWAEWCAVTPDVGVRLWAVGVALPRTYPDHAAALRRVVVEVAYRAAVRVQPAVEQARPDGPAREALVLVRRWLDGAAVGAAELHAAADAAAAANAAYASAAYASAAAAAAYAAYASAAYAAAYAAADATYAAAAAAYAAYASADADAEYALQVQDLEELLAALRLEVRSG